VCFTLSLLLFAIVTVRKITDEKEVAVKLLGTISSVASVAMFSSPLTSLVRSTRFSTRLTQIKLTVIQTKSSESMTPSLSIMGFIVSTTWTFYGYLIGDYFVQVRLLV
jgi:uncharacterized protein with PQ loop repeat